LVFEEVSYRIGRKFILDRLNLEIQRGEILVLLGRSGSGKTTALRLINRTLDPSAGRICLDGQDLSQVDPIALRRRMGYVIQEFGLLPHWTVEQNVALVPKLLGWPVPKQQERARELLDQVGLPYEQMRNRKPHELSGGQRQRVAVARALAASPGLLLFDEPFGALDPVTRHEMQQQFLQLRDQYQVAAVFVTHDILEALALGTKIAVLHEGKLEVVTTPDEFHRATTPTARAFLETLPREMMPGSLP
jgi:osmoprotectant transport system ATP-binding protein